jgi:hypothetical protein
MRVFLAIAAAMHMAIAFKIARAPHSPIAGAAHESSSNNVEVTIEQEPAPAAIAPSLNRVGVGASEPAVVRYATAPSIAAHGGEAPAISSATNAITTPSDAATWTLGSIREGDPSRANEDAQLLRGQYFAKPDGSANAESAIQAAIHDAANSILITRGRATFFVSVGADGKVREVRVTNYVNEAAAWNEAARAVASSLAATPLRVPLGVKSVDVWLSVDIDVRYPSGRRQGEGPDLHAQGIGLGGRFDLADLGSHAVRSIRVFRESEKPVF